MSYIYPFVSALYAETYSKLLERWFLLFRTIKLKPLGPLIRQ